MAADVQQSWLEKKETTGPVFCLGHEFASEKERRAYFRNELRKKLPELRKTAGFPIGQDEDIIALSDPPYYTACPNPCLDEFIATWQKEKSGETGAYHREPFTADVTEGKNDPIYNAHSYHTKVPHKAIMRYILHYTEPGDIVFDGFAGTGMTGVAAQLCGDGEAVRELGYEVLDDGTVLDEEERPFSRLGSRRAILNDLSPAATFIAYNYNNPVDAAEFEKEAGRILAQVEAECGWMYETRHVINGMPQKGIDGKPVRGKINYTVWSDVFICPNCTGEIVFWEAAVDQETNRILDTFACPTCRAQLTKRTVDRAWETKFDPALGETVRQAKQVPVLINYSVGKKRYEKEPDEEDLALIEKIEGLEIPYWFPKDRMPEGDESRRNDILGVTHVHHFYTKRNLWVLACANSLINQGGNPLLSAWFSSSLIRTTKMYKFTLNRKMGTVSGTLFIPSLWTENSSLKLLMFKLNDIKKIASSIYRGVLIETIASSNISIAAESIDYIFTDPPFGANLMYSELNFLWEAWLKVFTNNEPEAVVNKVQGKSLVEYQRLMEDCFREYYRVLKPGRWMTVEFSNSQASVWNAIQEAIQRAGFVIANVSSLDKKQETFKAVTTTTAVKQDLIISAYKPSAKMHREMEYHQNTEETVWTFLREHLAKLPVFLGKKGQAETIVERTPRVLFDRMVAYHVQHGLVVPLSSGEFQAKVIQHFPMRDGMAFLESQVAEYDQKRLLAKEFIQLKLFVADENSAIEWLRQQLMTKPQTRQELHPKYMKEIQHIAKHELLPELDELLAQNFLLYEGAGDVPSQIHSYLSTNYKDLRNLEKSDPRLKEKAMNRWYVPDPHKQADLEKLREKSLLREFAQYKSQLEGNRKKLRQFRTEAIRAGFKTAWKDKDYETIVQVGERLPEKVLQEDDKLLMYYDNALHRLGR